MSSISGQAGLYLLGACWLQSARLHRSTCQHRQQCEHSDQLEGSVCLRGVRHTEMKQRL